MGLLTPSAAARSSRSRACLALPASDPPRSYVINARVVHWLYGAILDAHCSLTTEEIAQCFNEQERAGMRAVLRATGEREIRQAIATWLDDPTWVQLA